MNKTLQNAGKATISIVAPSVLLLHIPANVSDGNTNEQLDAVINKALAAKARLIIVDLSEADSVSTVVLGQLLNLRRGAQAVGCEIRLAGVQPMVRRVLNICRLDRLFTVFSSHAAAMEMGAPAMAM